MVLPRFFFQIHNVLIFRSLVELVAEKLSRKKTNRDMNPLGLLLKIIKKIIRFLSSVLCKWQSLCSGLVVHHIYIIHGVHLYRGVPRIYFIFSFDSCFHVMKGTGDGYPNLSRKSEETWGLFFIIHSIFCFLGGLFYSDRLLLLFHVWGLRVYVGCTRSVSGHSQARKGPWIYI